MASKHHFIPQFYLEKFVDPASQQSRNPFLWVADLQEKTLKQRSPRNVAGITGYYEWSELQGTAPSIESILSQIEGRTARVFRKLWNGDYRVTDKDKYHLSIFLGLQMARTPHFKKTTKDSLIKHALDWVKDLANDKEKLQKSLKKYNSRKISPESHLTVDHIKEFINNKRFTITPNPDCTLQMTLKSGLELSKLIFSLEWVFIIAEGKTCFFTSDVPVALLTPDSKPRDIDFKSSNNPELEISFAVSPSCILLMREKEFPETVINVDDTTVTVINQRIFPVIDKFVFCSNEEQGQWALDPKRR